MARRFPTEPMMIDDRENSSCEYKAKLSKTYLKVADAFANYGTGRILFGVDDDGKAVGLEGDLDEICLRIENQLNDSIKPQVSFTLNPDAKLKTITLTVFEGPNKPYTYNGNAYKRSDTSAVKIDNDELRRLSLSGSNQTFDAMRSQNQQLSFTTLEQALVDQLDLDNIGIDTYKTLGLYKAKDDFGYTNAAAMLADDNEFSGVRIVGFGESLSVIVLDELIAKTSAIRQYERAVELYRQRYRVDAIVGYRRQAVELVPETAYREALANAIIHRRWDTNENVNISFFSDRIEVSSPGALPSEVSKREYFNELVSKPRNPLLAEVFHRLGYVELFGTGVRRINETYAQTPVAPTYTLTDHHIKTVLPVVPTDGDTGALNSHEERVLAALTTRGAMTRKEIEAATGLSRGTALAALQTLTAPYQDRVVRVGRGPSTKYLLKH